MTHNIPSHLLLFTYHFSHGQQWHYTEGHDKDVKLDRAPGLSLSPSQDVECSLVWRQQGLCKARNKFTHQHTASNSTQNFTQTSRWLPISSSAYNSLSHKFFLSSSPLFVSLLTLTPRIHCIKCHRQYSLLQFHFEGGKKTARLKFICQNVLYSL